MRILFVTKMGENKIMETNILPRVGDKVDMFWYPYPVVESVLLFPSQAWHERMNLNYNADKLDAIITLN